MKKIICIALCCAFALCGCEKSGESRPSDSLPLEFPDTQWDMTMSEVMDALGVTQEDTVSYSEEGRGPYFIVENRDVFGQTASTVNFSFINLKLDDSKDLEEFDEETMGGNEVLNLVNVIYPAGTDMDPVVEELKELYGEDTLSEITLYSPTDLFGTGGLAGIDRAESETMQLWGNAPVVSAVEEEDRSYFQENWSYYVFGLNEDTWDAFSEKGRMVTISCSTDPDNPYVQFNAYNLAVYNELKAQMES